MYYDVISSLPQLPYFTRADRLPITPLRLEQRLRRLRPEHAAQLEHARSVLHWRPERLTAHSDESLLAEYAQLLNSELSPQLHEYVSFRRIQQIMLAALRRVRDGGGPWENTRMWSALPHMYHIRQHWDVQDFGLEYLYPWLPQARERLAAGDAIGLEQHLMDLNWRWLSRTAEQQMFAFAAVFAYVFQWEMLKDWLQCDASQAKARFTELIDKVTDVKDS